MRIYRAWSRACDPTARRPSATPARTSAGATAIERSAVARARRLAVRAETGRARAGDARCCSPSSSASASPPGPTAAWPASRPRCSGPCGSSPGWTRCRRPGCSSALQVVGVLRRGRWRSSAGGSGARSSWRGRACSCSPAAGRAAARSSTTTCRCCWSAAVLAAAPVGLRLARRAARRRRGGGPCARASLVVTGTYFLTGFQKVVASGPAWVLSDNLRNVMYARAAHRQGADRRGVAASSPTARLLAHARRARSRSSIELGAVVALVLPAHARRRTSSRSRACTPASTSPTASTTRCGSAPPPSCSSTGDAVAAPGHARPAACTPS